MYRLCKAILVAYVDQIQNVIFRICLRGGEMLLKIPLRNPISFGEESTNETEVEECFDFWLQRVCQDVKRNDPTIDEVEIDPRGELCTFDDTDMRLLRDALHKNSYVKSLILRNIDIDQKSAEHLKDILCNTNALTSVQMEEIRGGEGPLVSALALTLNPMKNIQSSADKRM